MKVTRTSDKFYMQSPPQLKKKAPPMCVHIHTRIHIMHTHCTHIHTLTALTVLLSNSSIHLVLSCRDLLQDKLLRSYDTRKKCSAWLPECPGGLFICLFFSYSGRSSRVQRCSSTRDKPPCPTTGILQPHNPCPVPGTPALGSRGSSQYRTK